MDTDNCTLCPRNCKANRTNTTGNGYCHMGLNPKVARVAPHMWEEPCISGTKGSGAVFFSGCVMGCVFCQNYDISAKAQGTIISPKRLSEYYKELESKGVHNINLVNPTHFVDAVMESLNIYKPSIPIVYNCGGYENTETLHRLKGYVDIYLPDFKYAFDDLAIKYSSAPHYRATALKAVEEMVLQQPRAVFDNNGIMQKGVIVRHLVLPLNRKNSIAVLHTLKEGFDQDIYVSLMAQYIPCGNAEKYKELTRKITKREYQKVLNVLLELGLKGFTQELSSAAKDYIPTFNLT
ncbi:MAG TPA: radical SAM protein [Clostridiales bacterium]|nr:radical SAM protein [Clostridiales bacterium]